MVRVAKNEKEKRVKRISLYKLVWLVGEAFGFKSHWWV